MLSISSTEGDLVGSFPSQRLVRPVAAYTGGTKWSHPTPQFFSFCGSQLTTRQNLKLLYLKYIPFLTNHKSSFFQVSKTLSADLSWHQPLTWSATHFENSNTSLLLPTHGPKKPQPSSPNSLENHPELVNKMIRKYSFLSSAFLDERPYWGKQPYPDRCIKNFSEDESSLKKKKKKG